jgi:hypothetical protein
VHDLLSFIRGERNRYLVLGVRYWPENVRIVQDVQNVGSLRSVKAKGIGFKAKGSTKKVQGSGCKAKSIGQRAKGEELFKPWGLSMSWEDLINIASVLHSVENDCL